jgi:hypothetical protein
MTLSAEVLDEAFESLASSGFELPNGFVNHGPMACEALAALDCDIEIPDWARRFGRKGADAVDPIVPRQFDWESAFGDIRQLPDWVGFFAQAIGDEGWTPVVETWVPRLMPALVVALFHGAIRAAHAVRAVAASDTEARRDELARALGYWAARFAPGESSSPASVSEDIGLAVAREAAVGARYYLASPDIFMLHGVTGAMAVELLAPHIPQTAGEAALAQLQAEHAAMYARSHPVVEVSVAGVSDTDLAHAAADGRDPHEVKLVEACRRGFALTGDAGFAAAAETVVGLAG